MSTKDRIKAAFGLHKAKTADLQPSINAEAEKEEEIITANRRLIELMEGKISQVLAEI